MAPDHTSAAETAARVRQALADAAIGRDVTVEGLGDVDGIGSIDVADDAVTVTVTLPIPDGRTRDRVEREIRDAVLSVDGVERVTCRFAARAADAGDRVEFIPDVKHVVAVASGKGGVGKSTVAVNLAVTLARAGADVGLLDADVYGPNAPAMLGLGARTPEATLDDEIVPRAAAGVSVMSMGFVAGEDDPVIWRGPIVDEFLKQLFGDVAWGDLDYLIVDLPPGTGDTQLSLVQHLPVTGVVIVTTPQPVAVDDARRGLRGFARYDVPVLGIAENMAGFECPDCGTGHDLFGAGGADALADEFDVPLLGRIPIDPELGTSRGDMDDPDPPGVSIPLVGRVQLPRTREEREQAASPKPLAARTDGGTRRVFDRLATRTAARVNALVSAMEADDDV